MDKKISDLKSYPTLFLGNEFLDACQLNNMLKE